MKLQQMLNLQNKLQQRLGHDIPNMSLKERTSFIKEFSIHSNQEMNEMLYELPYFKPWKNYDNLTPKDVETSLQLAREEFIDKLHFDLNIALALGMDEDMIHKMYCEKNNINHKRQDEGY